MTKRKISLMLVVMMLLTMMVPTFAFGATDYSGHWAEKTIQEWFDNHMLHGYEDGSFKPDAQITRAEFMTMVNNAFEFTEKASVSFRDVKSSDWFYPEVQKAVKAGYIIGYEDNTARPEVKITRQEAALMIARIKELSNYEKGAERFNDAHEIASWAKGGVGAVANKKYMIGYEDGTFRPLRYISRAEAVVTIDRTTDASVEEPPAIGGGSNNGGSNGNSYTYAVLNKVEYNDGTTSSAITLVGYAGTVTTTSSAITITAIAATTSSAIEVVSTTSGTSIVSTSSAISTDGSFVLIVNLTEGDNVIAITVSDPAKDRPRTYYITVKKE